MYDRHFVESMISKKVPGYEAELMSTLLLPQTDDYDGDFDFSSSESEQDNEEEEERISTNISNTIMTKIKNRLEIYTVILSI